MHAERRLIIAASVVILAMVAATFFVSEAQENKERSAFSNGQGTLRIGDQTFKINFVNVKLLPDHKIEITLGSDITIFLSGNWSNTDSQKEFDLDMSRSDSRGGLDGGGKVVLKDEGKAIARFALKGVSRLTQRQVEANFEGQ